MNITLGNLPNGKWRNLDSKEIKKLKEALKTSNNNSFINQQIMKKK